MPNTHHSNVSPLVTGIHHSSTNGSLFPNQTTNSTVHSSTLTRTPVFCLFIGFLLGAIIFPFLSSSITLYIHQHSELSNVRTTITNLPLQSQTKSTTYSNSIANASSSLINSIEPAAIVVCPPLPAVSVESVLTTHLMDPPLPGIPPFHQSSYNRIDLHPLSCDYDIGDWIVRNSSSYPAYWAPDMSQPWKVHFDFGRVKDESQWRDIFDATKGGCVGNNVIRAFDPEHLLSYISGKTIAFVGDSMLRQQFGMFTLMLDRYLIGKLQYFPAGASSVDPHREYYFQKNVTIKNQWSLTGHQGPQALRYSIIPSMLQSDLMILHIGAFFDTSPSAAAAIEAALNDVLLYLKEMNYKGSILWREYSPTHFSTTDGEFDPNNRQSRDKECSNWSDLGVSLEKARENFRVSSANKIMAQHNIPILHIFNSSSSRYDLHRSESDCRHWLFPSSVLEHWNVILYNMIVAG